MRKLVVSLVVLAALAPAAALAGGWATVKLSSTPTGAQAGVPWVVDLTVLQHGQTPLADVSRRSGSPGRRDALRSYARPTAKTGIYRARVVFPRAGTWSWSDLGRLQPRPHLQAREGDASGHVSGRGGNRVSPTSPLLPAVITNMRGLASRPASRPSAVTARRRPERKPLSAKSQLRPRQRAPSGAALPAGGDQAVGNASPRIPTSRNRRWTPRRSRERVRCDRDRGRLRDLPRRRRGSSRRIRLLPNPAGEQARARPSEGARPSGAPSSPSRASGRAGS